MAENYLDDIVQNIITKCDLSDLHLLEENVERLSKKARSLGKAFSNAMTGEEQIALAKANAELEWNIALQRKSEEIISHNNNLEAEQNAIKAESNRLKAENNNATKIALQDTNKKLSQDRVDIQLSKERVAQIKAENKARTQQSTIMRHLGRLFLTYFSVRTLKSMLDTGSRLQLVQKSIQGLTKDTQDWDFIQQQAFKTGTDIEVVAKGYRNFFSSANMAGFGKGNIQNMYSDVLLSVRAIGASTQQTEGALLALEQMLSKGKVSMEELRRQLGNAIPGAFEIGAKAMNMTTAEFNKFVQTGKLASAEFVPKFIKELKNQYANGFKDIQETVDFASHNLKNAWKVLTLEIISGETGKNIAKVINSMTKALTSPTFIGAIRIIAGTLAKIVGLLGILIDHINILMPLIAPAILLGSAMGFVRIAEGLVQVIKAVVGVNFAVAGLNVGMVTLYANLLGTIGLFLVLEDLLKGGVFRRTFAQWKAGKDVDKFSPEYNLKSGVQRNGEVVFGYGGNMYRMPYAGNFEKDFSAWRPDSDVMNSYKKMWIESGKAKQILPYRRKDGSYGELELNKQETNTTNVTFGDINIVSPNADPKAVATTTTDIIASMLTGRIGQTQPSLVFAPSP